MRQLRVTGSGLWILLTVFWLQSTAVAAALAEPTTYILTIKRIELSRDNGASYIPALTGSAAFTITASQASGQVVGALPAVNRIPEGIYNRVRVVMSNSIRLAGNAVQNEGGPNNGDTVCTGGDTGPGCTETVITSTITNSTAATFGLILPGNTRIQDSAGEIIVESSQSLEVGAQSVIQYRLSFNTSQALVLKFFGAQDRFSANIPSLELSRS